VEHAPGADHAPAATDHAPGEGAGEHGGAQGSAESQVSHEVQESVGHAADEHGAFPPFDPATYGSQLLWLAVTFGFLYWFLSKVALPRLGGIIEERDNRVAADLAAAGKLSEESNAALAAYEQALAEARQRAQGIAGEARNRSKAETDAERARLEAQVNARMTEAEARIADVKGRALAEVDTIARDATAALVETLIGPRASPAEISAAVSAVTAGGRA
jgi:F-type H+-transporting ATPase subunit b